MMLKIIIPLLILIILISGCLETQELFTDTNSDIENEKFCNDFCDETNDLQIFREIKCEDTKCVCKCKLVWF